MSDQTPVGTPASWSAVISRLEAENEELRGSLDEWMADLASLKMELKVARAEAKGLLSGNAHWHARARAAEARADRLDREADGLQDDVQYERQRAERLEKQLARCDELRRGWKHDAEAAEATMREVAEELREAHSEWCDVLADRLDPPPVVENP